jgi:hypothetical protein
MYPIIAMIYSKLIFECKFMTKARTRESRISPNQARAEIEFNQDGLPIARDSDGNQYGSNHIELEDFNASENNVSILQL